MLQRAMPELMGMKSTLVINDEAHHCYREKPGETLEGDLKEDERKEAARLWMSGLEAVNCKLGVARDAWIGLLGGAALCLKVSFATSNKAGAQALRGERKNYSLKK